MGRGGICTQERGLRMGRLADTLVPSCQPPEPGGDEALPLEFQPGVLGSGGPSLGFSHLCRGASNTDPMSSPHLYYCRFNWKRDVFSTHVPDKSLKVRDPWRDVGFHPQSVPLIY